MIARDVLQRFREGHRIDGAPNTPLESYEWLKATPRDLLEESLRHLPHPVSFQTKPYLHQLVCFYIGATLGSFAFFLDMRLGKTKIILDLIRYRQHQSPDIRVLVLVPRLLHMEPWREQVPIHAPDLTVQLLEGSSETRLDALETLHHNLYVMNYAGLAAMVSPLAEHPKTRKRVRIPDRQLIKALASRFQLIVCDESTAIKNHRSLISQVCRQLSEEIPCRYILTGTPFGRSPEDLWAQFQFLDHGETLGRTLGLYREAFFTTKKNYWGGYTHTFQHRYDRHLRRRCQHRSITYEMQECLDLPPTIYSPLRLEWSPDAQPYYQQWHQAYVSQAQQAMEQEKHFVKLRQITAGFLRYTADDGTLVDLDFTENPKIEALLSLFEDSPPQSKFVVFHFFIKSGDMIAHHLATNKIKAARILSTTKDRAAQLKRFRERDDCRALIVNEEIGSMALDLQVAQNIVFYDLPVSPITRTQAEARCRGPQQPSSVVIHDLIMKGSVDERIKAFVQQGLDLRQAILKGTSPTL